jgi:hypothetical protein
MADLAALPLPWERQPGETAKAFAAFATYRDLPAGTRSLAHVQRDIGKSTAYIRQLEIWSSEHEWGERSAAHDQDIDRRKRERSVSEVVEMNARQATIAAAFEQALVEPLYDFLEAIKDPAVTRAMKELDPLLLLTLTERAARIWPTLQRAERLARGESTDNPSVLVQTNGHNQPPSTLDRAELVYQKFAEMGLVPPLADAAALDEG